MSSEEDYYAAPSINSDFRMELNSAQELLTERKSIKSQKKLSHMSVPVFLFTRVKKHNGFLMGLNDTTTNSFERPKINIEKLHNKSFQNTS